MSNLYHDGQEVTVIDAKGVRGPGRIVRVLADGGGRVSVDFEHHVPGFGESWSAGTRWGFFPNGSVTVGITIEPHPFTEEIEAVRGILKDGSPADPDPRDAEIARLHGLLKRAQPYVGPLSSWSDTAVDEAKALADDIAAVLSPDPVEGEEK